MHEAHGEQHALTGNLEGGIGHLGRREAAVGTEAPLELHAAHAPHFALVVQEDLLRGGLPETLAAFLVGGGGAKLPRPGGPAGLVVLLGRHGAQVELPDPARALTAGGADAVAARVAAAHDDDVAAPAVEGGLLDEALVDAVLLLQDVKGEEDAPALASRNLEVPRHLGAAGEHDGVVLPEEVRGLHAPLGGVVHARLELPVAHDHGELEPDAFGLKLADAALDDVLLELEARNAEAKKTAGALGLLVDRDVVARTGKLLGAGKARRARPHDGHTPSGPHGRRLGPHPALAPGAVDDGALDRADADGRVVEKVPRAARLADRGTDPARELGKGVRRREARPGALPVAFAHEAVPVDGTVVKRTVVRAERGAAVQAAQALRMNLVVVERDREVPEALDAFLDREMAEFDALVFRHGNLL